MIFSLEALQAGTGDCLILHHGEAQDPRFLLIDGGPAGIYNGSLKPRLQSLPKKGDGKVRLELAMVSHIDDDHIHGLQDLLDGLVTAQQRSEEELCEIGELWHNSFDGLWSQVAAGASTASVPSILASIESGAVAAPEGEQFLRSRLVLASVGQGAKVRAAADTLSIPVNDGFGEGLVTAEADAGPLDFDGLKLTILGPRQAEIDALHELWKKEEEKLKKKSAKDRQASLADYANRTAENLSSIVVLAELKKLRMLLSGDCGGDLILEDLQARGLLKEGGKFAVDLMKVPHHGSSHSLAQDFFERIPAKYYVISGNGKHGIPHPDALGWLSAARAGEEYDAVLTNRTGELNLTEHLTAFLKSEAKNQPKHRYHFRNDQDLSIRVDLLDKIPYLKKCTEL
jgi:beta-lactamase superfamily II metal-dependent hydrolase